MKKLNAVFLTLILMIVSVGSLNAQSESIHTEDKTNLNYSNIIDGIEFSKPDLWHGEKTKVTVTFSEKDNIKITDQTILTLDIPQGLTPFRIFKDDSINLIHNGISYGSVYTNEANNKIIVEFNENTNHKYNFEGSFYFEAVASYNESPEGEGVFKKEFTSNFNTDFIDVPYTISIRNTVGTSPFFYKPAGVIRPETPNYVNWWLHINRDQNDFVSDIRIVDTIKEGQEFVLKDVDETVTPSNLTKEYFTIRRNYNGKSESLSAEEFISKGYGTLEFSDKSSFEIIFFKEQAEGNAEYTVVYKTKITEKGKHQSTFYNDAIGYYNDKDGKPLVVEQLNRSADNINKGGSIAPAKGTLRIVKFATYQAFEEPLKNVEFNLYHEDGTLVDYIGNNALITNEDGYVDTPPLEEGKYYIQEIKAPDFVDFDPKEKHYFEINMQEEFGVELIVFNPIKLIDLEVEKVWNDSELNHEDITINLYADDVLIDNIQLTDNKLSHTFEDLQEYTLDGKKIDYKITEVPVEGYKTEYQVNGYKTRIINTKIIDGVLDASKHVSKDIVEVGEPFEYSIIVRNIKESSDPLRKITVFDKLPEGISFYDKEVFVNGVLTENLIKDNELIYTIDNLEYQKDITITFKAVSDAHTFGIKTNVAIITDDDNPLLPLYPSVDIFVEPPLPWVPINPQVPNPTDPTPEIPKEIPMQEEPNVSETPNTGISNQEYLISILIIVLATITLLSLKGSKTNKKE